MRYLQYILLKIQQKEYLYWIWWFFSFIFMMWLWFVTIDLLGLDKLLDYKISSLILSIVLLIIVGYLYFKVKDLFNKKKANKYQQKYRKIIKALDEITEWWELKEYSYGRENEDSIGYHILKKKSIRNFWIWKTRRNYFLWSFKNFLNWKNIINEFQYLFTERWLSYYWDEIYHNNIYANANGYWETSLSLGSLIIIANKKIITFTQNIQTTIIFINCNIQCDITAYQTKIYFYDCKIQNIYFVEEKWKINIHNSTIKEITWKGIWDLEIYNSQITEKLDIKYFNKIDIFQTYIPIKSIIIEEIKNWKTLINEHIDINLEKGSNLNNLLIKKVQYKINSRYY